MSNERPQKRSRNGNLINSNTDPSGFEFFPNNDGNQEEIQPEGQAPNWNWSFGNSYPANNQPVKVEGSFQEFHPDMQGDQGMWGLLSSSFMKRDMGTSEGMMEVTNTPYPPPPHHSEPPSTNPPNQDVLQTSENNSANAFPPGGGGGGGGGGSGGVGGVVGGVGGVGGHTQPSPVSSSSSSSSSHGPPPPSSSHPPPSSLPSLGPSHGSIPPSHPLSLPPSHASPHPPPHLLAGGGKGGGAGGGRGYGFSTFPSGGNQPTGTGVGGGGGGGGSGVVGAGGAGHLHSTKSFHSNPEVSLGNMSERTTIPVIKSLLPQISQRTEILKELARLKADIADYKPSSDQEVIKLLNKRLTETKKLIEWAATQIQGLYQSYLLPPEDIYALMSTHTDLFVRLKQLQVYQMEVGHLSHQSEMWSEKEKLKYDKPFGTLVIARQPFPKPLKQNTRASAASEDPTEVLLLHGARMSIVCPTTVKAELVYEEYHQKGCNFTMQGDVQELDNENNTATFSEIRFSRGTRLKMVRLQFMADVKYKQYGQLSSVVFESDPSSPFIIMTNESQWDFSEGILFKKDAFTRNEISWIQFSNILQMHYIRATRQDPEVPERPLSMHDLMYIYRSQFSEREIVTQKDFDRFWKWFGKVLHKIRHQKPFCQLWLKGLIFGFISKPEAEEVLKDQPHGTFIIRFSERVAGKMAIAYNRMNETTKEIETSHYLVAPHDKKETIALPDFLSQNENFIYVLKLRTDFDAEMVYAKPRQRVIGRTHKNEDLAEYYTKKISQKGLEGYENTHSPNERNVTNVLEQYDEEGEMMQG